MPNIFHQSVEDILKAATPEQKILWNDLFLRFGERAAVSQFCYTGALVGSIFNTYVARRVFVCYQITLGRSVDAAGINSAGIVFYDETNAISGYFRNVVPVWDSTAAAINYVLNDVNVKNAYFSRITSLLYNYVHFIGYRLMY